MPVLGTPFEAIDVAEDRERFGGVLGELGLRRRRGASPRDVDEAVAIAAASATRCWCARPTCSAAARCASATTSRCCGRGRCRPASLIDRFVEDAIEVDVDAVCDGRRTWIGAVMQHVEEAGVHSGDSACVIPTLSLGDEIEREIARRRARSPGARACAG